MFCAVPSWNGEMNVRIVSVTDQLMYVDLVSFGKADVLIYTVEIVVLCLPYYFEYRILVTHII